MPSSSSQLRPAPAGLWDWNGVVGTGQSLSVGSDAGVTPPVTSEGNLKLSLGSVAVPPFDPYHRSLSMVPLVEPYRPLAGIYPSAYPANIYGRTPHAAMASQIRAMVRKSFGTDHIGVHSVVGESGQPMSVIGKGAETKTIGATSSGRAYAATLFEAHAIHRLATASGKTYGVGAIVVTHGEADAENPDYLTALIALWSDYNRDLRAITAQAAKIPMLVSQQHSCPLPSRFGTRRTADASPSTLAQWQVGRARPRDIVCAGPKYQYPYCGDNVHMLARGYDQLGEKYGQVYFEKVVLGRDWQPLAPRTASRSGRVVTVHFHVPVPPLAWDEALAPPHRGAAAVTEWAAGRGFEVQSGATPLAIESVSLSSDTVRITCAANVPADALVGYAITADGSPLAGGTRRWGQLRDSDGVIGALTGASQPNYGVAFQMRVD